MSVASVNCPYCQTNVALASDAGTCGKCSAAVEVLASIEAARATAEYRENARVSPSESGNLWIVAVGG
jgi:hypothetical protein